MKLVDKYTATDQSSREIWDLGEGYTVIVQKGAKSFGILIDKEVVGDITLEIAEHLGLNVDFNDNNLGETYLNKLRGEAEELSVIAGIDCYKLLYRRPDLYMDLLHKIEKIINEKFKGKYLEDKYLIKAAIDYAYRRNIPTIDNEYKIGSVEDKRVEVILEGADIVFEKISRRRKKMKIIPNNKEVRLWVDKLTGNVELIK